MMKDNRIDHRLARIIANERLVTELETMQKILNAELTDVCSFHTLKKEEFEKYGIDFDSKLVRLISTFIEVNRTPKK